MKVLDMAECIEYLEERDYSFSFSSLVPSGRGGGQSGGIILTKTDIWFLAEVLKRKDKIEDLMAKAIDNGIEYWLVDKEKGGLENV